jgi:hypothetical protein
LGKFLFSYATVTDSFQAHIREKSNHPVVSLSAVHAEPGVLAGQLGSVAHQIETNNACDFKVA